MKAIALNPKKGKVCRNPTRFLPLKYQYVQSPLKTAFTDIWKLSLQGPRQCNAKRHGSGGGSWQPPSPEKTKGSKTRWRSYAAGLSRLDPNRGWFPTYH